MADVSIQQTHSFPLVAFGQIGTNEIQTVNARDLHKFLEVNTQFKDWIARRIQDYDFEEGKDFCSFLSESSGGRPSKEYVLSLDMAKELSMVERNERGKQARQYFIECERRFKEGIQPIDYSHPRVMLGVLTHLKDENARLTHVVEEQGERLQVLDRLESSKGALCLTDAAKTLGVQRKWLIEFLHQRKWIYWRKSAHNWVANDKARHAGLMEHHETNYINRYTREDCITTQARITAKGMSRLAEIIEKGKLN